MNSVGIINIKYYSVRSITFTSAFAGFTFAAVLIASNIFQENATNKKGRLILSLLFIASIYFILLALCNRIITGSFTNSSVFQIPLLITEYHFYWQNFITNLILGGITGNIASRYFFSKMFRHEYSYTARSVKEIFTILFFICLLCLLLLITVNYVISIMCHKV